MRDVVNLEAPTKQRDSHGQERDSWSVEISNLFAEVRTLSGRELEYAQQTVAQATHSVKVRWREGVTERKRFTYQGRRLNIQGIVDNYEEDEIVCICVETK